MGYIGYQGLWRVPKGYMSCQGLRWVPKGYVGYEQGRRALLWVTEGLTRLTLVTEGYLGLHGLPSITEGYIEVYLVTKSYHWLLSVKMLSRFQLLDFVIFHYEFVYPISFMGTSLFLTQSFFTIVIVYTIPILGTWSFFSIELLYT